MSKISLSEKIRVLAETRGIDVIGFVEAERFKGYAVKGSIRRDPRLSLAGAKTIIVAGIYIGGFTLPSWGKSSYARTSRLFLSGFFNDIVEPLEPIVTLLKEEGYDALPCDGSKENGSVIPLKLAAIRAGFGWQGKNSLLVTKKYGTFLALGGILTDARLDHNHQEETNLCKDCTKCRQTCPTGALAQEYILNRDKCLSHILQGDAIPQKYIATAENRVMDCEICQQVCPWNAAHIKQPLNTPLTQAFQKEIPAWEEFFSLAHLSELKEEDYKQALGRLKTGIPYRIFRRNVGNVIENNRRLAQSEKTNGRT